LNRRLLVAGIGNILLSDDGFGVAVARRLADRALPDGVRVADFGIRGVHLAYELLDGYDALVLIDALPLGERPGTLAVVEPEPAERSGDDDDGSPVMDAHRMSPEMVLATLASLGGEIGRVLIVGCQPADLSDGIGLTPPVEAAVDAAADLCCQLVEEIVGLAEREADG
jgi:hydrogenase maturation protease